jgi:hypothetical protein
MAKDRSPELHTYALMGVCLLHVQMAERVLGGAVELVLRDPTLTLSKLMEQTERDRKRTLGEFLKELRSRARLEPKFKDKLWRFLQMRNTFVHNLSEVPGLNAHTEQGRKVAREFLVELLFLAISLTFVFLTLFSVSAREDFGKELIEGKSVMIGEEMIEGKVLNERAGKAFRTVCPQNTGGKISKACSCLLKREFERMSRKATQWSLEFADDNRTPARSRRPSLVTPRLHNGCGVIFNEGYKNVSNNMLQWTANEPDPQRGYCGHRANAQVGIYVISPNVAARQHDPAGH